MIRLIVASGILLLAALGIMTLGEDRTSDLPESIRLKGTSMSAEAAGIDVPTPTPTAITDELTAPPVEVLPGVLRPAPQMPGDSGDVTPVADDDGDDDRGSDDEDDDDPDEVDDDEEDEDEED